MALKKVGNLLQLHSRSFYRLLYSLLTSFLVAGKAKAFLKENGAKIAKVGLKGIATYYKLASHAAAFIPVIGKPLGKALSVASKAADFGSDQIHANLDGKWGKAASVMNTIQHPVGKSTPVVLYLIHLMFSNHL